MSMITSKLPPCSEATPALSVVIPLKDEEGSLPLLANEIEAALDGAKIPWEALWIDDGSSDGSLEQLRQLTGRRPKQHRWVQLAGNHGQSGALALGFRLARAPVIATLDADLQNDPADIPRLYTLLHETGTGMVNGVRARRKDSRVRKFSSRIANGFRNWVTHEQVTDVGCSLRVFRTDAARGVPTFRGMHRFFPTLMRLRGVAVSEVAVSHRQRQHGQTKYGISNRLWVGILDTFGVWWLQRRWVETRVAALSWSDAQQAPNGNRHVD
jgi:glycosyltransferase involved in cell wall biosynthesis